MGRSLAKAFTLLELLVVIGIIGVLLALLLPMLIGLQARGRDVKCQSNLRQIVNLLINYSVENNGSMPYGFYWTRSSPVNWTQAPESDGSFICWPSVVARYARQGGSSEFIIEDLPPILRCPEAEQVHPHPVSYVMNMIVGVIPEIELTIAAAPRAQLKPPKTTLLMKETALVWDTAVQPGWEKEVGFLAGLDIDDQRFWLGAGSPQVRYYSVSDPFSRVLGGILGQNRPIRLDVKDYPWRNIDPPLGSNAPYQGNLRFRHRKQRACNVGFSDGSVRQFNVRLKPDLKSDGVDALRRYFMIKWPPGVPPDTTRPF